MNSPRKKVGLGFVPSKFRVNLLCKNLVTKKLQLTPLRLQHSVKHLAKPKTPLTNRNVKTPYQKRVTFKLPINRSSSNTRLNKSKVLEQEWQKLSKTIRKTQSPQSPRLKRSTSRNKITVEVFRRFKA